MLRDNPQSLPIPALVSASEGTNYGTNREAGQLVPRLNNFECKADDGPKDSDNKNDRWIHPLLLEQRVGGLRRDRRPCQRRGLSR